MELYDGYDSTDLVCVSSLSQRDDDGAYDRAQRRADFVARLTAAEVRVESVLSRDSDELLLCLSAPHSRLERRAEQIEMEKKLKTGAYTDFTSDRKHEFEEASESSFWTSLERQRLLLSIIEGKRADGCCGVDLATLVEDKVALRRPDTPPVAAGASLLTLCVPIPDVRRCSPPSYRFTTAATSTAWTVDATA